MTKNRSIFIFSVLEDGKLKCGVKELVEILRIFSFEYCAVTAATENISREESPKQCKIISLSGVLVSNDSL